MAEVVGCHALSSELTDLYMHELDVDLIYTTWVYNCATPIGLIN